MIIVSAKELLFKAAELVADGQEKVAITENEADSDSPASLSFESVDEYGEIYEDYEEIWDVTDDDSYSIEYTPDSIAPYAMTFQELALVSTAFQNAIENLKTCLNDKTISADERSQIVSTLKHIDASANKLNAFLRDYHWPT